MRLMGMICALALAGCGGGVALEELPDEYSDALCSIVDECLPPDVAGATVFGPTSCRANFSGVLRAGLDSTNVLIERGTLTYDASAARACIDQSRALGCDAFIAPAPEVCSRVFIGTVEDGGDCSVNDECAGDAYCDSPLCPDQAGVCTPTGGTGDACAADAECTVGLACEDQVCRVPASTSGGECGGDSGLECPLDEFCSGDSPEERGTCVPWDSIRTQAEGDACDPENDELCEQGLACAITAVIPAVTWECRARVGAGEACSVAVPNMCPDTHYCDTPAMAFEGTCEELPSDGEPCATTVFGEACAPGHVCDPTTTECVQPQDNGAACDSAAGCFSGNCEGGTCTAEEVCE